MGLLLILFPDNLRDYLCDRTVAKCERLSGCGLGVSLSGLIGLGLLGWSYMAFVTRSFKESEARTAVVRGMLFLEVGGMVMIGKDINIVVYSNAAWPICAVLLAFALAHTMVLTRGDAEHKELRARASV